MPALKPLNIVVASDNHYIILLAALIKSIEANLSAGQSIIIYIIEDNISASSKKKLQLSVDPQITSLVWKAMSGVIPEGMKLPLDRSSYPLNIYMRLFIPYFIPEDVEKVLYLDVDMIVQRDISVLFYNDLKDYVVGAVLDPRIITFDNSWGGVLNYKELGLPGSTKYFNTGLLLMNTLKWRAENVTERIISCIDNHKKFANYPDQYGLNVVLANQWLELDPRWNHFCTIDHPDPYLIHFVQRKPIYKSYDNIERFKKIFNQYLDQTKWKNFKPIGESSRYIKKIKNVLNKFFKWK
jgi:lipopolysaccharide biosynthesis glycosyltransferase